MLKRKVPLNCLLAPTYILASSHFLAPTDFLALTHFLAPTDFLALTNAKKQEIVKKSQMLKGRGC